MSAESQSFGDGKVSFPRSIRNTVLAIAIAFGLSGDRGPSPVDPDASQNVQSGSTIRVLSETEKEYLDQRFSWPKYEFAGEVPFDNMRDEIMGLFQKSMKKSTPLDVINWEYEGDHGSTASYGHIRYPEQVTRSGGGKSGYQVFGHVGAPIDVLAIPPAVKIYIKKHSDYPLRLLTIPVDQSTFYVLIGNSLSPKATCTAGSPCDIAGITGDFVRELYGLRSVLKFEAAPPREKD